MKNDMFEYYKEALSNNLCNEYKGRWRASMNDKNDLMQLALSQQSLPHVITYSYNGHGLSKEYLLKEFGELVKGTIFFDADGVKGYSYSMFVDVDNASMESRDIGAFLFCDDIFLSIPETNCPILYVGCKSNLKLNCDGYNSIRIYLFDESKVELEDVDETCDIIIYKYSDKCKVGKGQYCFSKNIKEFEKELRL